MAIIDVTTYNSCERPICLEDSEIKLELIEVPNSIYHLESAFIYWKISGNNSSSSTEIYYSLNNTDLNNSVTSILSTDKYTASNALFSEIPFPGSPGLLYIQARAIIDGNIYYSQVVTVTVKEHPIACFPAWRDDPNRPNDKITDVYIEFTTYYVPDRIQILGKYDALNCQGNILFDTGCTSTQFYSPRPNNYPPIKFNSSLYSYELNKALYLNNRRKLSDYGVWASNAVYGGCFQIHESDFPIGLRAFPNCSDTTGTIYALYILGPDFNIFRYGSTEDDIFDCVEIKNLEAEVHYTTHNGKDKITIISGGLGDPCEEENINPERILWTSGCVDTATDQGPGITGGIYASNFGKIDTFEYSEENLPFYVKVEPNCDNSIDSNWGLTIFYNDKTVAWEGAGGNDVICTSEPMDEEKFIFDCPKLQEQEEDSDQFIYEISNAEQLAAINNSPEALKRHYVQTADIDLSSYPNWTPIGISSGLDYAHSIFSGTYDGQGYKISNLTITEDYEQNFATGSTIGLFGLIADCDIRNVILENIDIDCTDMSYPTYSKNGFYGKEDTESDFIDLYNCHVTGFISINVDNLGNDLNIGDGTSILSCDPIDFQYISSAVQLIDINNSSANLRKHYIQTANIDLSSYPNWTPIGDVGNYFRGSYNGNGYKITGLTINESANYKGLFGITLNSYICNIDISGSILADIFVGGIVGFFGNSAITYCNVAMTITSNTTFDHWDDKVGIGGIVGSGYWPTGAYTQTVINCHFVGTIAVQISGSVNPWGIGGIVGIGNHIYISLCSFNGDIDTNVKRVGGIIGLKSNGIMSFCQSKGIIKGIQYVGGIAGSNTNKTGIPYPWNPGEINTMYDCLAECSVEGDYGIGGVAGEAQYQMTNCLSRGEIIGNSLVGGCIGSTSLSPIAVDCFYDSSLTSQIDTGYGEPKDSLWFENQSNLENAGFDFNNIWEMGECDYSDILE